MDEHEDILLWLQGFNVWVVTLVGAPRICDGLCNCILRLTLLHSLCLIQIVRRRHDYRLSSTTEMKVESRRHEGLG